MKTRRDLNEFRLEKPSRTTYMRRTYPDVGHWRHGRGPSPIRDGRRPPSADRRRPVQAPPGRAAGGRRLGPQRPAGHRPGWLSCARLTADDRRRRGGGGGGRRRRTPRGRRPSEPVFQYPFLFQDGVGRRFVVRPVIASVQRGRRGGRPAYTAREHTHTLHTQVTWCRAIVKGRKVAKRNGGWWGKRVDFVKRRSYARHSEEIVFFTNDDHRWRIERTAD